jgi:hypothetical protein
LSYLTVLTWNAFVFTEVDLAVIADELKPLAMNHTAITIS